MKKTLLASLLALISANVFADTSIPNVKSQMKVTANVAAGCDLTAENIDFGVLQIPLIAQKAQANINVKCSKGASLSIAINYGETISNASSGGYTVRLKGGSSDNYNRAYKVSLNGVDLTTNTYDIHCMNTSSNYRDFQMDSQKVIDLYGLNIKPAQRYEDIYDICNEGMATLNINTFYSLTGGAQSGVLKGINAGEKVIYSLEVPNQSSTVWSNYNKYSFVATGEEQLIPMKATIDTINSPTHRLTPDNYQDTLTVVLNY